MIGGTLLAIGRDGRLFAHDKDVDLGLPFDTDREALATALTAGFTPMSGRSAAHAAETRAWVMGYVHDASGIGLDLMFVQPRGERVRFELGWPDHLACEVPTYPLQTLRWHDRDWQVPSPPERYLDAIYGPDWQGLATSRGFDRRYFDTQVSNPSRTADSLPRAINLVLSRLLHALQQSEWVKSHALCAQLLAREEIPQVREALSRLQAAGHAGLRTAGRGGLSALAPVAGRTQVAALFANGCARLHAPIWPWLHAGACVPCVPCVRPLAAASSCVRRGRDAASAHAGSRNPLTFRRLQVGKRVERLQLEVRVTRSPELAAHDITLATRALGAGDRATAQRLYAGMASVALHHSTSWGNLAALALGLDDATAAQRHAARAIALDPTNADAWVNLGVARWHAGMRQEGAQATHRALQEEPRLEAAALNMASMLRTIDRLGDARGLLDRASAASPRSWRLAQAVAEVARLQMDHAAARAAILQALPGRLAQCDLRQPARSGLRTGSGADVRAALEASSVRLDALGVGYHLMAGTLLAIVKDGRLFAHDKDVDLALPDLSSAQRDLVHAAFAADADYQMFPPPPGPTGQAIPVIGLVHAPTGVGIDLFLPHRDADDSMRFSMGWPDQVESVVRPYGLGTLQWDGRDWPVPEPAGQYLEDVYGPDWRDQLHTAAGITYDRCYSDTMVSNASRTPESVPRAVTLGLIRLVRTLGSNEWPKAVAYCAQLLAREEMPQVRMTLDRLQAAGHSGLRAGG